MLRGRHRGLPVAIDRAVMLPMEFERYDGDEDHEYLHARQFSADSYMNGAVPNESILEKPSDVDNGRHVSIVDGYVNDPSPREKDREA